jgi:hypothetical protein
VTRSQQIDKAIVLLDPPPRDREQYRADMRRALDEFEAHKASRRPSPTLAKAVRNSIDRLRKLIAEYVAEGGHDPALLQKALVDLDRSIRVDRTSLERCAIVLARDLLLGWGRKASKTRGGKWDRLAGIILRGTGRPSLFQQLRKLRHAYPDFTAEHHAFAFVFEPTEAGRNTLRLPHHH